MNNINVLYKNVNFKTGSTYFRDFADDLDTPIFASDVTLSDLLRRASITKQASKKHEKTTTTKQVSSTKVVNKFQKHPRYISNDSIISLDESVEEPQVSNKQHIEAIINKIVLKDTLHSSDETCFAANNKSSKVLSTNLKLSDPTEINKCESNQKKMPKQTVVENVVKDVAEDVMGVKLKPYLIKINAWQQEARTIIQSGIVPIESSEDYYKRERRTLEFASRFNRNYLYQLGRQLVELRRYTQKHAVSRPGTTSAARNLTSAVQIILQGVQAYCNHVPNTILTVVSHRNAAINSNSSIHEKFCDLMKDTCDLCRIIKKLSCIYFDIAPNVSLVEDIDTNSKALIHLVEDSLMRKEENEGKSIKHKKQHSNKTHSNNNLPFQQRSTIESRLSMYSVAFKKKPQQIPVWKKNAEKLAKQRFPLQNRSKKPKLPTVTENNRTPSENKRNVPENKRKNRNKQPLPLSDSSSSGKGEKFNEDEIQTMVELDAKKKSETQSRGIRSRVEPLLRTLVAEVAAGKEDDVLGQGVCEDMLMKLQELLEQVQRPKKENVCDKKKEGIFNKKKEDVCEKKSEKNCERKKEEVCERKKDEPCERKKELYINIPETHITITGPRNAKLICIRDASLFESKTEVKEIPPVIDEKSPHAKSLVVLPRIETKFPKKRVLLTKANLPKQFMVNILQYKLNFHNHTKHLLLYKKTSQVLPWVLTEKLADALFNHLLISVLNEININSLAQNLYVSEFETY